MSLGRFFVIISCYIYPIVSTNTYWPYVFNDNNSNDNDNDNDIIKRTYIIVLSIYCIQKDNDDIENDKYMISVSHFLNYLPTQ